MSSPTIRPQFQLPDDHVIELYEPPNSGQQPMLRGTCPGCGNSTTNYVGRCAAIRELNVEGVPIAGTYTTSFGHLPCVELRFQQLIQLLEVPDVVPDELTWQRGTQRDVTAFIDAHVDVVVQVRKVRGRPRSARYDYRVWETS